MGLIREIRSAFAHSISFRPDNEAGSCTLMLLVYQLHTDLDWIWIIYVILLSCPDIHCCNIRNHYCLAAEGGGAVLGGLWRKKEEGKCQ